MKKIALISALALSGCVHTEEMQIAPNIVRIDTRASGALFAGHSGDVVLQRAAKVTLASGYDYFKLSDAQLGQGSQFAGVAVSGNQYFSSATPVYAATSAAAATVVMFRAGDPQAKDAFEAKAIIARLGE